MIRNLVFTYPLSNIERRFTFNVLHKIKYFRQTVAIDDEMSEYFIVYNDTEYTRLIFQLFC